MLNRGNAMLIGINEYQGMAIRSGLLGKRIRLLLLSVI